MAKNLFRENPFLAPLDIQIKLFNTFEDSSNDIHCYGESIIKLKLKFRIFLGDLEELFSKTVLWPKLFLKVRLRDPISRIRFLAPKIGRRRSDGPILRLK